MILSADLVLGLEPWAGSWGQGCVWQTLVSPHLKVPPSPLPIILPAPQPQRSLS